MASLYRIPLATRPGPLTWIDDLDLPFLLRHGGESGRVDIGALVARTPQGKELAVQWLPSSKPSAAPGQRRGSLLVEGADADVIELFVHAGADEARQADDKAEAVRIEEKPDTLEIGTGGQAFTSYRYNTKDPELPRPYFHPVVGPTGKTITQLGEVAGKREKHFHHTALWIAHQNFAAQGDKPCDNWQIGRPNSSKIEHVKFESLTGGALAGRFIEKLRWLNVKGDKTLLEETRTVTIPKRPATSRLLDIEIVLTGQDVAVTLNKTPYHVLAVRVLDAMLPAKGGAITNSNGAKNPPDGAAASWIDISGRLDDQWQGVALFNHPENLRQPTPCLQFAGQTIGLSPSHKEAITIEPGKTLRLRYRVLVHAGNVDEGKVAEEYEAYVKAKNTRVGAPEKVRG